MNRLGSLMKNSGFLFLAAILLVVIVSGCRERTKSWAEVGFEQLKTDLASPHKLRKMFEETERVVDKGSSWSFGGGFFFFIGGAGGSGNSYHQEYNVTFVTFAWQNKDSSYVITRLPLDKVRVKIVDQGIEPTAQFYLTFEYKYWTSQEGRKELVSRNWSPPPYGTMEKAIKEYHDNVQEFFSRNLAYAVITCQSSDWPKAIKLPIN